MGIDFSSSSDLPAATLYICFVASFSLLLIAVVASVVAVAAADGLPISYARLITNSFGVPLQCDPSQCNKFTLSRSHKTPDCTQRAMLTLRLALRLRLKPVLQASAAR